VQFIELLECCGSSFENGLANKKIFSDATGHQYHSPRTRREHGPPLAPLATAASPRSPEP
jgi:hypothetical protein